MAKPEFASRFEWKLLVPGGLAVRLGRLLFATLLFHNGQSMSAADGRSQMVVWVASDFAVEAADRFTHAVLHDVVGLAAPYADTDRRIRTLADRVTELAAAAAQSDRAEEVHFGRRIADVHRF